MFSSLYQREEEGAAEGEVEGLRVVVVLATIKGHAPLISTTQKEMGTKSLSAKSKP